MARDTVLTKRMIRREKADRTQPREYILARTLAWYQAQKKDFGRSVTANLVSA